MKQRYDSLEEYIKDLQADRPSAVFSRLGDDKELAIVLRTAKTVHLLTRRPDACHDFAETLERRLLVQHEETVQAERRILRWGYVLPGMAVIGVALYASWHMLMPNTGEASTVAQVNTSRNIAAVSTAAVTTEFAIETMSADPGVWEKMDAYAMQLDADYNELETTMAAVDAVYNSFDYTDEQVNLSSIGY